MRYDMAQYDNAMYDLAQSIMSKVYNDPNFVPVDFDDDFIPVSDEVIYEN
jgi:hypothetical protein